VNRENLTFADMETWRDDKVGDLIRTLRKTHQPAGQICYAQVGAIENLKTIAYVCRYHAHTRRTATISLFTRNFLVRWKTDRLLEADYNDYHFPKLTKGDDATILDFIQEIPEKWAQLTW
jgi:hypothetical protein